LKRGVKKGTLFEITMPLRHMDKENSEREERRSDQ